MKVKLLIDILFEYGSIKKTMFKTGGIFTAFPAFKWIDGKETDILDGYWIGSLRVDKPIDPKAFSTKGEAPGALIQTKCFLNECEIYE